MGKPGRSALAGLVIWVVLSCSGAEPPGVAGPDAKTALKLESPAPTLWDGGVGEGFRASTQTLSLQAGGVYGFATLGGKEAHDLALVSLCYGHMLGHTVGRGSICAGNFEFRGELFTGAQFAPTSEWIVGLTPHLRYNFATGTRWIPYLDAGAGVTATSIGPPDLSNIFEFNLQAGLGIRWFFRDNLALSIDSHYFHLSCARINSPNLGLNGVAGMIGLTWIF